MLDIGIYEDVLNPSKLPLPESFHKLNHNAITTTFLWCLLGLFKEIHRIISVILTTSYYPHIAEIAACLIPHSEFLSGRQNTYHYC